MTEREITPRVARKCVPDMYVVEDSGVCLSFGCARLSHCELCCGPPTGFPCGHRCTVGVLAAPTDVP